MIEIKGIAHNYAEYCCHVIGLTPRLKTSHKDDLEPFQVRAHSETILE
jgi:hypothetical protein